MERSNRREFLNIVGEQDLELPEHIQNAISDPEILEAFDRAFPEVGIYIQYYIVFANLLDSKHSIKINSESERRFIIDLLRQKRIENELLGMLNG